MGPATTARVTNRSASVLVPRHHGTDESVIAAASDPTACSALAPMLAVPVEASIDPSAALTTGSPCPLAAANGALTASVVKERFGSEGESPAELQRAEATEGWRATMARFTGRDGRLFAATLAGLLGQPRLGLVWLAYSSNARLIDRVIAARLLLRRRDGETSAPSDEAAGG